MHPQAFTELKQKIESSSILSDAERKEWLFLLPRMTEEQMKELDRIVSVRMPNSDNNPPPARLAGDLPATASQALQAGSVAGRQPSLSLREGVKAESAPPLKVRGGGEELLNPIIRKPTIPAARPVDMGPIGQKIVPAEIRRPAVSHAAVPLPLEIASLSSLTASDIVGSKTIYVFLEDLHHRIVKQVEKGVNLGDIMAVFDKSPLHKTYLDAGVKFLTGKKSDQLSREEFEAITDFRASLKKLG